MRDAQRQSAQDGAESEIGVDDQEDSRNEPAEQTKKRKRKDKKSLAKLKQENKPKNRRIKRTGHVNDNDERGSQDMYRKVKSLPGQLSNCEICEKRFTVTPYSRTGPDSGLLCTVCSKKATIEGKKSKCQIRGPNKSGRRQKSSNILDGIVRHGALSLLEMCIKVGYTLVLRWALW